MARGGRGGGGRNPANQPREVQVSRALSKLLRHGAEQQGLKLGKGGYVNLQDALNTPSLRNLKITLPELREIVASNDKQRFSMIPSSTRSSSDPAAASSSSTDPAPETSTLEPSTFESDNPSDYLIRANQGHSISIDTDGLLTPITLSAANIPTTVVHGTDASAFALILLGGGLRRMGRTHIHFASGLPAGVKPLPSSSTSPVEQGETAAQPPPVISGMRTSSTILIYIDIRAALAAGIPFFISENGVILTKGDEQDVLSYKFFQKVESRKEGRVVMMDGVLPEGTVVDIEAWKEKMAQRKGSGRGGGGGGGRGRGGGAGKPRAVDDERDLLAGDGEC